ncbi:hypothetical protein D3C72_1292010 [compost metagenome]
MDQAVAAGLFFTLFHVGAEQAVEDDQHAAVVGIQVIHIRGMVHAVRRRGVEYFLEPAQLGDPGGMQPELVQQVQAQRGQHDLRANTKPDQRGKEHRRAEDLAGPAKAIGGAQRQFVR